MRVKGVDVSSLQGNVDWKAVKESGIGFAYLRCAHILQLDSKFEQNVLGCRDVQLRLGAYFVFHPGTPAKQQVNAWGEYSQGLGSRRRELPPAIDWEIGDSWGSKAEHVKALRATVEATEEKFHCQPLIYTYPHFVSLFAPKDIAWLKDYPLWLAHYKHNTEMYEPGEEESPRAVEPWGHKWTMWQYIGNGGQVYGVRTDCDRNVFNGDSEALLDFAHELP